MRDLTFEIYVQKLAEQRTNGYDLALKILAEMFGVSIIVLFEKYLWKSEEKALDDFHLSSCCLHKAGSCLQVGSIKKKINCPNSEMSVKFCKGFEICLSEW